MLEIEKFGMRISQCRQNKNMTQDELARRLGITPQALSKWERGQSLPDVSLLAELGDILGVSVDYLLGRQEELKVERGSKEWDEVWKNLRRNLDAVELIFGKELVQIFVDDTSYVERIGELRRQLSKEGILLPTVRLQDHIRLKPKEFMVLSYQNVLYSEELDCINENTMSYMIRCLGNTVRKNYHEVLNPNIVKGMADNLSVLYSELIQGIVPEKISYNLLTEVLRGFVARGNSMIYFEKVIEYLENALRETPNATVNELVEIIAGRLERKDNLSIVLGQRKTE